MKSLFINDDTIDVTINNLDEINNMVKRARYQTAGVFMKDPTGNEAKVIINIIKINLIKSIVYNVKSEDGFNRQMLLTNDIAMQLTNIISEQFVLDTKELRQSIRALLEITLRVTSGRDHPLNLLMNGKYIDNRLSLNVIEFKHLYIKHNNLNKIFD